VVADKKEGCVIHYSTISFDRNGEINAFYIHYLSLLCVKYVVRNVKIKERKNLVIVIVVKSWHNIMPVLF